MELLIILLLLLAAICFAVTAFGWVTTSRFNLLALGLFFWVLTVLIASWPGVD